MTSRADLRVLAESTLRAETGAAAIDRLCPRCGSGQHGQPLARGSTGTATWVSISYATDLVGVAWSHDGPVGIDIEVDGPPVDGVGDRGEWTRAEALLKAAGTGLDGQLQALTTEALPLPEGYVGTLAGSGVSWRLAGPAAPDRAATR